MMERYRRKPARGSSRLRSDSSILAVPEAVAIALLMTWAAGFIDVVGYLSLFGLYTAHMSGNTIAMARHIVEEKWWAFARGGWPIATFVFGLVLGAFIFDAEQRRGIRPRFPGTIALETLLIALFVMLGAGSGFKANIPPQPALKFFAMVALLTVAMGLQNVSIRKVGGMNIYTTFVTGSLVKFGESFTDYLFWLRDRMRNRSRGRMWRVLRVSVRQISLQRAALTFALWATYLAGAIGGEFATLRWALLGMLIPLLILMSIVIYGTVRPLIRHPRDEW